MEKSISNLNIDINMKGLDLKDLMGKALNSSSAEVFKYEWKHADEAKDGELKFFYLRIKNKNEVLTNPNIKVDVDCIFGSRSFKLPAGILPVGGSQSFLIDSQTAIQNASA